MRRERERKKERKRGDLNHLSVHQWLRSAIRDSQQPISPIGFLFLKLPPPACAVLLVQYGIYIYTYTICRSPIDHLHVISRSYTYIYIYIYLHTSYISSMYHLCIIYIHYISIFWSSPVVSLTAGLCTATGWRLYNSADRSWVDCAAHLAMVRGVVSAACLEGKLHHI